MVYKAGKRTGVENTKFISFNLTAGTYSIDDFNAKNQGGNLTTKTRLGTTSN